MPNPASAQDAYGLLGVHPAASAKEIRLAYRQRAMTWHPDRNHRADAEKAFKRIRCAYEILSDPARRADYDRNAASAFGAAAFRRVYAAGAAARHESVMATINTLGPPC